VNHLGIDSQHQRLVALVNDLYAAMAKGQGRAAVTPVLTGLIDDTKTHFSYEEQQMERASYPLVGEHRGHHGRLLQDVERYVEESQGGRG
jgi:hemerythrin